MLGWLPIMLRGAQEAVNVSRPRQRAADACASCAHDKLTDGSSTRSATGMRNDTKATTTMEGKCADMAAATSVDEMSTDIDVASPAEQLPANINAPPPAREQPDDACASYAPGKLTNYSSTRSVAAMLDDTEAAASIIEKSADIAGSTDEDASDHDKKDIQWTSVDEEPTDMEVVSPADQLPTDINAPPLAGEQSADACAISSASAPSTSQDTQLATSRGRRTSLVFNDGAPNMDEDSSTYNIEPSMPISTLQSSKNGTWKTDVAGAVKFPVRTAKDVLKVLKRRAEGAPAALPRAKRIVAGLAGAASDEVTALVNNAMIGYDVPRVASRVIEPILNMNMPSSAQASKLVDNTTDAIYAVLERGQFRDTPMKPDFDGVEYSFADDMSKKALRLLVGKKICEEWQMAPTQNNAKWQIQLRYALVRFFLEWKQRRVTAKDLLRAIPFWTEDVKTASWELNLDLDYQKVYDDADISQRWVRVSTGFKLSDAFCRHLFVDVHRGSTTVDDNYEYVHDKSKAEEAMLVKAMA